MAQVSPSTYKALSPQYDPDYSNGQFIEEATGNVVTLKDSEAVDWHDASLRCRVFEDFLGSRKIPASADTDNGPWLTKDTSSGGTPTLAILGDASHGAFKLGFDATDEAQILTLYWGNELNVDYAQNPVITYRLQVSATPNANDILAFGISSDQHDTVDTQTAHAIFRLEGANLNLLVETDDNSTNDDDNDTGVDLTAATYYEFKIDLSDLASVKFYYRATLGGEWTRLLSTTTFTMAALATNLQPFVQLQKSGGTHTTYVLIDYVDVSWDRD